jgi:hypothetical protein
MFVFIAGNLSDGYGAFGPYESFDEACELNNWREGWIMEMQQDGASTFTL